MKSRFIPLYLLLFFTCFKLNAQTSDKDTSNYVFEKVDIDAAFPGGEAKWRKFLEKNLNPSIPTDNGAPVGVYVVQVSFLIDKDGKIIDVRPLTSFGYGMEDEVVRVIKKGEKWTPAIVNGRTVKAWRKQPISFVSESEDFEVTSNPEYTLYTGQDNYVMISVRKVKTENLSVKISKGSIVSIGEGQYKVRVDEPGSAVIELFNTAKNKKIGAAHFTVEKSK